MNILVTGACGQLGSEIRNVAMEYGEHRFIFSDVSSLPGMETLFLDITDAEALRLVMANEKVDAIINCAAYTDVEKAENDQSFAELLNRKAPANLAAAARETGALLIHVSTDYVFHGDNCRPYRESDEPAPLGVYGVTKFAGEKAIEKSGCRYVIVRTSWLYSPYGKNFVKTMRNLTSMKDEISVVCDQIGTPTYARDLAGALVKICVGNPGSCGIYHFSDEGAISWYDFACAIRDLSCNTCRIRPCSSAEFPSKVTRPHYSVLDKSLIKKTFGLEIPHWFESLKDCISRM